VTAICFFPTFSDHAGDFEARLNGVWGTLVVTLKLLFTGLFFGVPLLVGLKGMGILPIRPFNVIRARDLIFSIRIGSNPVITHPDKMYLRTQVSLKNNPKSRVAFEMLRPFIWRKMGP
jgi:hypothetical protein